MNIKPTFSKTSDGLLPAIVQDFNTSKVLMQGYMNQAALDETLKTKKVTFFSRSKNRLWVKGETSNNFLNLKEVLLDCDSDSILIKAIPEGPTCHTGQDTCWGESNNNKVPFLTLLTEIIKNRKNNPHDGSYTASLFANGITKLPKRWAKRP